MPDSKLAPGDPQLQLAPYPRLSPSSLYMRVDDNLRITAYNALASVILGIRSRVLSLGGEVQASADVLTPATDRSASSTIVVTDEGWLLGGEVFATGAAPLIGQTYVVVELVRGLGSSAIALQTIAAGYITAKQPLPFPNVLLSSSVDNAGAIRAITGTTPGAGVDISEAVPTGARWELLAFSALLTSAVAVANRIVQLTLDDGVTIFARVSNQQNQAASLAWNYSWIAGGALLNSGNLLVVHNALPVNCRLAAAARIRTATTAIQAADQWSAVKYLVREWIEGA